MIASGIDISKYSDRVLNGIIKAQLDFNLIEYYKLRVQVGALLHDVKSCNEDLKILFNIITFRQNNDAEEQEQESENSEMLKTVQELNNMKVAIDLSSIDMPQDRLIPKTAKFKKK